MQRVRRVQSTLQQNGSQVLSKQETPTVASLGFQVRLVPVNRARARDVADLVAACESLRQEADRLLTRVIKVLREEERDGCVGSPSYPRVVD